MPHRKSCVEPVVRMLSIGVYIREAGCGDSMRRSILRCLQVVSLRVDYPSRRLQGRDDGHVRSRRTYEMGCSSHNIQAIPE